MYSERVVCNTVYIINAKKLVIKYEWIELVDNGVLSMFGCGLRWFCSSLIPSPHTTVVLCCT